MTSRDFCYWLQGFFELRGSGENMSAEQVACVAKHLALVFKHEIDPSAGPPEHQAALDAIHSPDGRPSSSARPPIGGARAGTSGRPVPMVTGLPIEYEIDAEHRRTGRWHPRQFRPTLRYLAVPPSQREPEPWRQAVGGKK